jgi:hypothetical protein
MSKIVVSAMAVLVSASASWAQSAPHPGTLAPDLRILSKENRETLQSSRNRGGVPAKRVKSFFLAPRLAKIPQGYGLSLGRIKPLVDVRNDQLHYGR